MTRSASKNTNTGASSSSSEQHSTAAKDWPIKDVCESVDLCVQPVSLEIGVLLRSVFDVTDDGALHVLAGKMYIAGCAEDQR